MAFPTKVAPSITGKGARSIMLYIPDPDIPEDVQYGELTVQIKYSNGRIEEETFDLLERLTDDTAGNDTHLPALIAIKTYVDARIDAEILGL